MLQFYLSLVSEPEDKATIELIYHKYRKYMAYEAFQILKNEHDAEDAAAEALYRIAKNIKKIDASDPIRLKNLCGITAANVAKNMIRDNKINNDVPLDTIINTEYDINDIPVETLITGESLECAVGIIEKMNPVIRDVMFMYMNEGMSYLEIGEILGINSKTVSAYISKGKKTIAEKLKGDDGVD